ncbi:MAG: nucleotide exchange factor GrpE [Planctomycetota bacterium]|jgi:molecular chaperone GrpE (heat shock protein)
MFKKFLILGLVLFISGAALLGWVFAEQRKEKQLERERREKLRDSLSKLDEIVDNQLDVTHLDSTLYVESEQPETENNRSNEEKRQTILTIGSIFALTGGAILGWVALWAAVWLLAKAKARRGQKTSDPVEGQENVQNEPATTEKQIPDVTLQASPQAGPKAEQSEPDKPKESSFAAWRDSQRQARQEREKMLAERAKALSNAGRHSLSENLADKPAFAGSEIAMKKSQKGTSAEKEYAQGGKRSMEDLAKTAGGVNSGTSGPESGHTAVSVCEEEPKEVKVADSNLKSETELQESCNSPVGLEESFKSQAADLERQMAEFRRMAQSVQQNGGEQSTPVENSLKDLAQQVSAIREYAANQQERVKKLQDGYDWNIIRNFCLRVIRCIDNLESRIDGLTGKNADTKHLEDVRDELVFALESTGVESFEPEVNSDYRGQEKHTEAIKERERCKDPKLTGKIAKVVRRGYQYCIDEENFKVVRPAQVKLFGSISQKKGT